MDMMDFALLLMAVSGIAFVTMFVSGIVGAKMTAKHTQKDDNATEIILKGTVIEKNSEVYNPGSVGFKIEVPIEWVLFEDENGQRKRYRNVKVKDIFLAPGDKGMLAVRGETIYSFIRNKEQ